MISEYLSLAFRNLRRRGLRSWLTMIGIFIGIAAVVSLIGLGEGLRAAITSQFGVFGTDKLAVQASGGFGPPGTGVINPLQKDYIDGIKKIPGVKSVAGRIIKTGKMEYNNRVGFGYAGSIPEETEERKLVLETLDVKMASGRMLRPEETGKVVLGNDFSKDNNGFGKPIEIGKTVIIQEKKYEVIGIMEKKGSFLLDSVVLMNDKDIRDLFDIDNQELSAIAVQVENEKNMDTVKAKVEDYLRRERDVKKGEEDFSVQTPQAALGQVNSTIFAVQLFVYIIAGISIIVGGIGIMNTMFTSVVERTAEIGIMKSLGAKNSTIFQLFFIESGFLGLVGGLIGVILGLFLAYGLASVGQSALGSDLISAKVSPILVISALIGSFLLGSFFGIIPAMRASKLHPVDALRGGK